MAERGHSYTFFDEKGEPIGVHMPKCSYCDLCGRNAVNVKAGASIRDESGSFTVVCWDCFRFLRFVDVMLGKSELLKQTVAYSVEEVTDVLRHTGLPEHIQLCDLIYAIRNGIGFPIHDVLEDFDHNETLAVEVVRSAQRYLLKHGSKRLILAELVNQEKMKHCEVQQRHLPSDKLQQLITCDNCCKRMQQRLCCGRCKLGVYCSKDCQKAHWRLHKPYCLDIKELSVP